jgi:hypothetical protein
MIASQTMNAGKPKPAKHSQLGNLVFKGVLWGLVFGIVLSVTLIFELLPVQRLALEAGQVSSMDIRAPR